MSDYIENLKNLVYNFDKESELDLIAALTDATAKENIINAIDNPELGVSLESLGLTLADIDDESYMHVIPEEDIKDEDFAKSDITPLYRYVAHTSSGYGSSNIGSNSRSFCVKLASRTNTSLMRYVDILRLNGSNKGFGQGGSNVYSVFRFRGGVNCKHIWVKYLFNKKTKELIKAPREQQPSQIGAGDVPNA